VPVVTTIHNIHNPKNFKWAGRILRQSADFIIFESNYERNRLLANGLPPESSPPSFTAASISIDFPRPRTADFARQYGLEPGKHLISASWPACRRKRPQLSGRCLRQSRAAQTRNPPADRGRRAAARSNQGTGRPPRLAEHRDFAGMQRDIPSHLALLDVFVLSSTRESFPLSAREAMAAGRCVIAPRIGGCGEVVEDGVTGLLFTAADVDDLAAKMLTLSERDTVAAMGRAGRQRAERLFSRHVWVDGDEKVYLDWSGLTSPSTASVALS
jgi:Glycosyltransferase